MFPPAPHVQVPAPLLTHQRCSSDIQGTFQVPPPPGPDPSPTHPAPTWAPFPWLSFAVSGPGSPSPSEPAWPELRSARPGSARPGRLQGERNGLWWWCSHHPGASARADAPKKLLLTLGFRQQLQTPSQQRGRHDCAGPRPRYFRASGVTRLRGNPSWNRGFRSGRAEVHTFHMTHAFTVYCDTEGGAGTWSGSRRGRTHLLSNPNPTGSLRAKPRLLPEVACSTRAWLANSFRSRLSVAGEAGRGAERGHSLVLGKEIVRPPWASGASIRATCRGDRAQHGTLSVLL